MSKPNRIHPSLVAVVLIVIGLLTIATDLSAAAKKVMVLGIDGMDPKLLQTFVDHTNATVTGWLARSKICTLDSTA